MSPLATVDHEQLDEVTVVHVRGEIDVSNGEEIQSAVLDRVMFDTQRVVLDLTSVEYFDSVGVRLAFELQQRLDGQRIGFAIVRDQGSYVRKVLELCGAEQVLDVFDDLGAATGT